MQRINVYAHHDPDDYTSDAYSSLEAYTAKPELAGWFDLDKATMFRENTEWDGSNHISVATGSQWDHEMLIRTKHGRWVLHTYSNRQGVMDGYRFIHPDQARDWLLRNDGDEDAEKYFGEIEEEHGPGRPKVGEQVCFTIPAEDLAVVDAFAEKENLGRSAALRLAVKHFITTVPAPVTTETTGEQNR